jgi:hypothetical protein
MTSATQKKSGAVFAVRYIGSAAHVSDDTIGTYQEDANGDLMVHLERLPWGGGHMLMRPCRQTGPKAKQQRDPI